MAGLIGWMPKVAMPNCWHAKKFCQNLDQNFRVPLD